MFQSYQGEIAALLTALFWTVTALSFEAATKRVGTYAVNLIRLILAFIFLGVLNVIRRGMFLPVDASAQAWFWLGLSGIIGFVLGDLFLFASFAMITSRIAMLIMTLVPPFVALISYFFLGEVMSLMNIAGMTLVVGGISLAILGKPENAKSGKFKYNPKGLFFALLGSIGQAIGLVLSKYGMGEYDAFAATHIRIIFGLLGFGVLISILRKWGRITAAFTNRGALGRIGLGAFFGPFLGVSFSLLAVQLTLAGIASSIMAIVPVLIILPSVIIFKQKVTIKEIIGAVVSVSGVLLFFL